MDRVRRVGIRSAILLVFVAIGCKQRTVDQTAKDGGAAVAKTAPSGSAPSREQRQSVVKVWFLDGQRMLTGTEPLFVPVERKVPEDSAMRAAVEALFAGPTAEEQARGLRFVDSRATGFDQLRVEAGVAHVQLRGGCDSGGSTATIANELMPTLKQFPEVRAVKLYDPSGKTQDPEKAVDSIPVCLEP